MGKTPWECLITVSMKKSASTVLWTRFKILMLRVFMCRFSPKRYLWCSAPVLSIGPIIIPLTLFMIFDCDMVGGCGWYETLSYGSIWTLVLLNCPCWWWWRHRCCCCRLIGTPPPYSSSYSNPGCRNRGRSVFSLLMMYRYQREASTPPATWDSEVAYIFISEKVSRGSIAAFIRSD